MSGRMSDSDYAEGRMTIQQKSRLIEYMEEHPDFARGKFIGVEGKITLDSMWEILSEQLNSLGPKKSSAKWKRAWFDLKTKTKRKAATTRRLRQQTGGGSPPPPLSEMDEKVLKVLCEEAVYGLPAEDVALESGEPSFNIEVTPSTSASFVDQTLLTPDPLGDHDYYTRRTNNNYIAQTDKENRQSPSSSRAISTTPGCSSDTPGRSRRIKKKRYNQEEAIRYFQESEKIFDKKIDTAIALLKDNQQTLKETKNILQDSLKETNKLLQELINVIREK